MPLIAREDSLLVVVDLQPRFWGDRINGDDLRRSREVAARAAWLAGAASALGIPAVVTEEEREHNGPTDAALIAALHAAAPVFTKPVFGLAACADIIEAISSTGRRTAVLAGYETDVCVTHSAIGLREAGYRVVVAEDAVFSPFEAQAPRPGGHGRSAVLGCADGRGHAGVAEGPGQVLRRLHERQPRIRRADRPRRPWPVARAGRLARGRGHRDRQRGQCRRREQAHKRGRE